MRWWPVVNSTLSSTSFSLSQNDLLSGGMVEAVESRQNPRVQLLEQ